MRRFFVGVTLDETARNACANAARRLQATGFAARYEDPAKFHVTLAFLGNVDAGRSNQIVAAVRQAAAQRMPFAVHLDKLGAFPHERKPRIVYAGARDQGADFRRLAQGVREAFRDCGFDFAEDSVAHVTLARVKKPMRPLPLVEISPIPLRCDRLSLFESIFDKEKNTSRYEVLFREKLGSISEA
jgi:RNA 2',3'-cyclic 3'-phosphodiesterase